MLLLYGLFCKVSVSPCAKRLKYTSFFLQSHAYIGHQKLACDRRAIGERSETVSDKGFCVR